MKLMLLIKLKIKNWWGRRKARKMDAQLLNNWGPDGISKDVTKDKRINKFIGNDGVWRQPIEDIAEDLIKARPKKDEADD